MPRPDRRSPCRKEPPGSSWAVRAHHRQLVGRRVLVLDGRSRCRGRWTRGRGETLPPSGPIRSQLRGPSLDGLCQHRPGVYSRRSGWSLGPACTIPGVVRRPGGQASGSAGSAPSRHLFRGSPQPGLRVGDRCPHRPGLVPGLRVHPGKELPPGRCLDPATSTQSSPPPGPLAGCLVWRGSPRRQGEEGHRCDLGA